MWKSLWRRSDGLTGEDVLERLRTRFPGPLRGATADTPLANLPMDSLDVVELLCLIDDEFGVRVGQTQFQEVQTVGELAAVIARAAGQAAGSQGPTLVAARSSAS
jgi:acyl carrier protein